MADTEALDALSRTCESCGFGLRGHKCKMVCDRCGYFRSCSDLF